MRAVRKWVDKREEDRRQIDRPLAANKRSPWQKQVNTAYHLPLTLVCRLHSRGTDHLGTSVDTEIRRAALVKLYTGCRSRGSLPCHRSHRRGAHKQMAHQRSATV
jgi:hypothetical protein